MRSDHWSCGAVSQHHFSWLIDNDKEADGMRVLADLHGGDPEDMVAKAEFQEIKDRVTAERESGEARSYAVMWRRYKRRVLLAMSSQAFAQLVSLLSSSNPSLCLSCSYCRTESMVSCNGWFSYTFANRW